MIGEQTVLALIPARGGSKGIPRKNIHCLAGKPLIEWTIAASRKSCHIDRTILSSDDAEIIDCARRAGCDAPFVRPAELATDEAGAMAVIRHAIAQLPEHYDYLVLLQPTSPLRKAADIDACLTLCHQHQAPACVSVSPSDKSPSWMFHLDDSLFLSPVLPDQNIAMRRQEAKPAFIINGAVYVARTDWLLKQESFLSAETIAYVMPPERAIDIDTPLDLKIASLLLQESSAHED